MPGPGIGFSMSDIRGQATIFIGLGSDLFFLGIALKGVEIQISPLTEGIPIDPAGPQGVSDYQNMGAEAHISAQLTAIDLSVVEAMFAFQYGVGDSGSPQTRGAPIFASNQAIRVVVATPSKPYNFPTCRLMSPYRQEPGTKYNINSFEWGAWQPITVDSSGTAVFGDLYNSSTT